MANIATLQLMLKGDFYMILPDHLGERLRAVFAV
jgi:hypothetical protein